MEMLLVLAILAAFVGMTLPSILRMNGQRQITEAAERVRNIAASARVRAIESGLIYQFCCEPNGRHFVVVPYEADHASGDMSGGSGIQNSGVTPASRVWGELPSGVVFGSLTFNSSSSMVANTTTPFSMGTSTPSVSGGYKIASNSFDGLPNAGQLSSINWSPPILYDSNGSANTDAQVVVQDKRGQSITLKFRAFTGAVSMERISVGKHK